MALESALDLGEFVSYKRSWDFMKDLEDVKHKIDALLKDGQAERAVSLYKLFLSGCSEKADEIDDSSGNLALCAKTGTSPTDCENIADIFRMKRKYQDALSWIDKGLKLEEKGNWGNQSSFGLTGLKQDLLNRLGCREDALDLAWAEYKKHPSNLSYEKLMEFVDKKDVKRWHQKALGKAQNVSLSGFIEICTKTKEWDKLAEHISSIDTQLLEELSHYTTQRAAKGLAKKHNLAAAIIYSALGMRIIKKGKSKYYHYALEHFRKACKLYEKSGRNQLWIDLVERVRKDHSRKYSFIGDFEEIVDRRPQKRPESFETRALKRWKKQTS